MTESKTYWNHEGKYQNEYDILNKKYVPYIGMRLTGNKQADKATHIITF